MRRFSVMNPGWLKRLAILCALILGQSKLFGQISLGQSKDGMRPEAVAELKDYYKKIVEVNLSLDKLTDRQRLDYATNLLMIADTADMKEEVKRWKKEIYLNHPQMPQAIYFRKVDGWKEISSLAEEEYCDTSSKLDEKRIGKLGNLMVAMFREHGRPKSYKEVLLTYLVSEESRPSIATMMKEPDQDAAKQEEYKALRIIIANADSPEHQIIDLDEIKGVSIVNRYKQYLYEEKISDSSRTKPLIAQSVAQAYLRYNQPTKAQEALSRIQGSEKRLDLALVKSFNEIQKGNKPQAIATLEQFITGNPTEAAKKKAQDVQALLKTHNANIGKLDTQLQNTAKAIAAKKPEGFLIRAYQTNKTDGLEVFLRFDKTEEAYEVVLLKDKKVLFALKVSDEGTATYFPNGETVKKMPTRIFSPKLKINPDNLTAVQFGIATDSTNGGSLGEAWNKLLAVAHKIAANGPALEEHLKDYDFLISKLDQDGSSVELRSFDGTEESKTIRLAIDKEMLPKSAEWSNFALEFVTWDVAEAKKTIGALWPKVKDQVISEINVGEYVSVFGQLMTYLQEATNEKPAEVKPAGEK